MCHLRTCALTNNAQQPYALPPQSSPQKNHMSEVAVMLKTIKLKGTSLENFPAILYIENFRHEIVNFGGFFECNTYQVMTF